MSGKNLDLVAYKKFLRNLKKDMQGRLIVNDTSRGQVSPSTIAAQIERNRPDVVFVDYLTLMGGAGDWQQIAALSGDMKALAMRYQVPIVAAAQINRAAVGENHPRSPPQRQRCHRPGCRLRTHDAADEPSRHQIQLAKYRHGMDGQMWYTEFRPNSGSFTEVSGDEAQEIIDEDKLDAMNP